MDVVDLLTPVAAVVALFAALLLAVLLIRQGRALRRLEARVDAGGGTASRASLDRISQLQARMGIDSGEIAVQPGRGSGEPRRRSPLPVVGLLGAAALGAGGWWFFLREDDPKPSTSSRTATGTATGRTTSTPAVPVTDQVPQNPPRLANKADVQVAVWNGSGVRNAAATYAEQVANAGYSPGVVGNAPPPNDLAESVVMYARGSKIPAWNVAKDLGMRCCVKPMDGITPDQIEGARIVLVVGTDLASKIGQSTTGTP